MTQSIFLILFPIFAFVNSCGQADNAFSKKIATGQTLRIKVGESPGSVEAADFNKDSFIDLAVTSETDSSVLILLGNGQGSFTAAKVSSFFAGPLPNDIAIKDFNNDGYPDLAFAK